MIHFWLEFVKAILVILLHGSGWPFCELFGIDMTPVDTASLPQLRYRAPMGGGIAFDWQVRGVARAYSERHAFCGSCFNVLPGELERLFDSAT